MVGFVKQLIWCRESKVSAVVKRYRDFIRKIVAGEQFKKSEVDDFETTLCSAGVSDPEFQSDLKSLQRVAELEKEIEGFDEPALKKQMKEAGVAMSLDAIVQRKIEFQKANAAFVQRVQALNNQNAKLGKAKRELTELKKNSRLFG